MRPVVGHTYQLKEAEYRFGVGTILVTVARVAGQTGYESEPWWRVEAYTAYGTAEHHGGWEFRAFLEIKARNLRSARVTVADAT